MPPTTTSEKYAVYRDNVDDAENRFWLVDTGVGGTWSPDVDQAQWFDSHDDAINMLYACDLVEPGANWTEQGFVILRVK
jgi:hypothetical protein